MDVVKQLNFLFFLEVVIIISSSFEFGGSELFYIAPSSCRVKPCLTLSQFAANTSWLQSNTSLIFLRGNHSLNLEVTISDIYNFSMFSNLALAGFQVDTQVICQQNANFKFDNISYLWIKGLRFVGCGNNRVLSVNKLIVEGCTFHGQRNSGTALEIIHTNASIENSHFISNTLGSCCCHFIGPNSFCAHVGGAITIATHSNVTILKCMFVGNSAEIGGAVYVDSGSTITTLNSTFIENYVAPTKFSINDTQCSSSALNVISLRDNNFVMTELPSEAVLLEGRYCIGSVFAMLRSRTVIDGCLFRNNINEYGGAGGLYLLKSFATISNSRFWNSTVQQFGGVLSAYGTSMTFDNCTFHDSSAYDGGAMDIMYSSVMITDSTFDGNTAKVYGGAILVDQGSRMNVSGSCFFNNRAESGGALSAIGTSLLRIEDSTFSQNQAREIGGVAFILQSQITFCGTCNLTDNYAASGGALHATESSLIMYDDSEMVVMSNTANGTGGGLYLYRSQLECHKRNTFNVLDNKAKSTGGGIHAINSLITVYVDRRSSKPASMNLIKNSAQRGGGIYLESAAQIRIQKTQSINDNVINKVSMFFKSNSADYGEAIYVADETYFDICARESNTSSTTSRNGECFIQVLSPQATINHRYNLVSVEFMSNNNSGSLVFGGLLDRCTPDPFAEIFTKYLSHQVYIDGETYLKGISNIDTDSIRSSPVRVCFCGPDDWPDCSYEPPTIKVKKGESFNVSLVAVDQVNHTVANVMIHSSLKHTQSGLGEGQLTHVTNNACTNLTFNIYSRYTSEQLTLYAEGPCRNTSRSQRTVSVSFKPCNCPIGFQPKNMERKQINCECVCDSKLSPCITDGDCNYLTESLSRKGNFWITYVDNSSRDNSSDYLIYPHCPLDYCLSPKSKVQINLNVENGADVQCANYRSGVLCGTCQPGLSLSLGSSNCIPCSKAWYKQFVVIVIVALLAGIALIALLMVLNLTVAVGTLNGLIFYANIIGASSSTFFTGPSSSTRFIFVFISWLNLEVGFDICFFEGMDTYWKTWLQLAFPSYVIFLTIMIIIVSEYSLRFSHLIARKNPVATLATVILLSFTMFLRTIIAVLSFAILDYPDGHKRVWLPDASIEYLSGKHIALLIVAILILIVGSAYTCLLFFWQWLLHHQSKTVFKWVKYQRLCHFIEPYHAPYEFKHRYWTGLLLFVRVAGNYCNHKLSYLPKGILWSNIQEVVCRNYRTDLFLECCSIQRSNSVHT